MTDNKINIVYGDVNNPDIQKEVDKLAGNTVRITPEMTVYHGQRVKAIDPRALQIWSEMWETENIDRNNLAHTHTIGLLDLTLKLWDMGKGVIIHLPETYLHPAIQLKLGDAIIKLNKMRPK